MIEYINPYKLFVGSFIPNWLLREKEMSQGAKLCYARLCQYAGKNGIAWPAQKTLADELGCSEREVQRYLKQLIAAHLIKSEQRGLGKPNIYTFPRHRWMELDEVAVPDTTDVSPPDTTDTSYKENQGRESESSEPPRQPEIDSSAPLLPESFSAKFFLAEGINEQVAVLVDCAKANGREVRGGRIAGLLKRHDKNKTVVMLAFMEAIARNVAVIEDYTEGVLVNGQESQVRHRRLDTDGRAGNSGQLVAQGIASDILTEEEARRLLAARAAGEGGGGPGSEALAED